MQARAQVYIEQAKAGSRSRSIIRQTATVLSLLVILAVFWRLKLTGITIAGDAFCGKAEHVHSQECEPNCSLPEHTHDKSCYSDIRADVELALDWKQTTSKLNTSVVTADNVVSIAQAQLGYQESVRNFQVDALGDRRGITRYGQWYGNPYGDWSAMFVAFCLNYANVEDVPFNAGSYAMQMEWEAAGLYRDVAYYTPHRGDVLFLAKNGTDVDAVAIIVKFDQDVITVVEGDVNDQVVQNTYSVYDPAVRGYGLIPDRSEPTIQAAAGDQETSFAKTVSYNQSMFTDTSCFVVYTETNGQYYAFDGSGQAVPITIDSSGNIFTDLEDKNLLLWTFSGSNGSYTICNLSTGRYMHAYANNGGGVTTAGSYTSNLVSSGGGVKIRSNTEYARLDLGTGSFVVTQNSGLAAVFKFGMTSRSTVWLDGTAGGQGQLGGSVDRSYAVTAGSVFRLPEVWQSPSNYEQRLRGWYDVTNHQYYAPGAEIVVTGNMVFYADWVAATYDIGQYNAQTSNTVSTGQYITTYLFDYNYLFNVMSANPTVTVNGSSHSERWSMVQNGNVAFQNRQTLDFVFIDYDGNNRLSDVGNRDNNNNYRGAGIVTPGIYTPELGEVLFGTDNCFDPATGEGILGKTFVGTGDYLFHLNMDPNDKYYGYYYYDSQRHAAAYNQTDQRFYVYDYLVATTDSVNSSVMSDFLPFNSPYANTNGKSIRTYTYAGDNGEYQGINHYSFESKYSANSDYVVTNYAFGMRMDVLFYLPNVPGALDEQGNTGNRDVFGNEMHYEFQGDDDVWILVDGVVVLDLGGIHGIEGGDVNFSTGVVTVNGKVDTALSNAVKSIQGGEHTMTILYLERGSSQSNSAFYFNVAPRFSLNIQKEDVLTQEVLNGAQFSVFTDSACTQPAKLYTSEENFYAGETPRNTFTITNGTTYMWGLASGNTYYIKETRGPDAEGYGCPNGIIRLKVDKDGIATYYVDVIADTDGTPPSNGFTVHNVRIDEQNQSAYIVVTNAPETVTETTTVQVFKKWEDSLDHSSDYIAAYLTVTDPDGTVRRIREVVLSAENGWMYTWTNLPKYDYEMMAQVQYGIEESYESGYYSTVRKVTEIVLETTTWADAVEFRNGQSYILKTSQGFLSTKGPGKDVGFQWVDEETAKTSPYALWTAHISGNTMKLTNAAGQVLTINYNGYSSNFFASTAGETSSAKQYFRWVSASNGFRFYYRAYNNRDYYITSSMNTAGRLGSSTSSRNGLIFQAFTKVTEQDVIKTEDWAYQILNTPLAADNETSLTVKKQWDLGMSGTVADYEKAQVTVKLYANGLDTGRIVTLSLKNGWTASFLGLPYQDADGNPITYSVLESWENARWRPSYSPVEVIAGNPPAYSTVITNTHVSMGGPELPATGSAARMMYILCGASIIAAALVYGLISKYKRESGTD